MRHSYHLVYGCRPLLPVVALLLGISLNHWAFGQTAEGNKDSFATPNAATESTDRKRDGLNGNVKSVLFEQVETDASSGTLDESKRVLVSAAAYDPAGKKIYATQSPLRVSSILPSGNVSNKRDNKGNVIEMVIRSNDGKVLRKESYRYEFDSLGNWTKKTTHLSQGDGASAVTKPFAISFRTIAYYPDNSNSNQAQSQAPANSNAAHVVTAKEPDRAGEKAPQTNTGTAAQELASAKPTDKNKVTPLMNVVAEQPAASHSPVPPPADMPGENQPQRDPAQGRGNGTDAKPDETSLQNAATAPTVSAPAGANPAEMQQPKRPVSGGVLNGRPLFLPVPEYPASARESKIGGAVVVKVNVDEFGKVTSADVESGPVALRAAAMEAALHSLFTPTLLSGRPTKATASINYNFAAAPPAAAPTVDKVVDKAAKPDPNNSVDPSAPAREETTASINKSAALVVPMPAGNSNPAPVKDDPVPVKDSPAPAKDAGANSGKNAADSNVSYPAGTNPVLELAGASTTASPVAPTSAPVAGNTGAQPAAVSPTVAEQRPLESIYKVGVGDILDIQVPKVTKGQSTLFTVQGGGIIDYPVIGEPLVAAGMTTDELSKKIAAELKRRAIIGDEKVFVNVREYSSHRVMVSGLVNEPGSKLIQREAVPLFVLLAQASPKPEAGRAVITSATSPTAKIVNLSDPAATGVLVGAGDAVHLVARPQEFIYVGGEIGSPGRRNFTQGVTLTQILLECGGATYSKRDKVIVKISRQNPDGRLSSTDYSLVGIEGGQVVDPMIQAGDRIVVGHER